MATSEMNMEAAKDLCKIFGLEPDNVKSFSLRMDNDELILVNFEIYVEDKQLKETVRVFQRYELVERGTGIAKGESST